jgi:hypothetical protein
VKSLSLVSPGYYGKYPRTLDQAFPLSSTYGDAQEGPYKATGRIVRVIKVLGMLSFVALVVGASIGFVGG